MRTGHYLIAAALLVFTTGMVGCKKEEEKPPPPPAPNAEQAEHDHDGHDHDGHGHGEVAANLAKLPAPDRALVDKQQICLVGNEPLGAMGVPIKVDVEGTPIFICCAGCKDAILADKQKYLDLLAKRVEGDDDGS